MTLFLAISTTMICLATSITKLYFCHRYNDGIIDNKFKTEWAYKRRRPRPKLPTAQDRRRLQFESAVDSTKVLIFNTRNGELVQIAKCITPTSLAIWIRSRQYDSSDIQHKKWRVGPDSQVDNTDIAYNLNPQLTVREFRYLTQEMESWPREPRHRLQYESAVINMRVLTFDARLPRGVKSLMLLAAVARGRTDILWIKEIYLHDTYSGYAR